MCRGLFTVKKYAEYGIWWVAVSRLSDSVFYLAGIGSGTACSLVRIQIPWFPKNTKTLSKGFCEEVSGNFFYGNFLVLSWRYFCWILAGKGLQRDVVYLGWPIAPSYMSPREMENISRGPTFGDFVTIRTERSMQDGIVARLQSTRVQEYKLPSPPFFKCNVLRESLSVDSQNIPCAILKRMGSWVISDEPKCWGRGGVSGSQPMSTAVHRSPNNLLEI